jgi:hypothetical protein
LWGPGSVPPHEDLNVAQAEVMRWLAQTGAAPAASVADEDVAPLDSGQTVPPLYIDNPPVRDQGPLATGYEPQSAPGPYDLPVGAKEPLGAVDEAKSDDALSDPNSPHPDAATPHTVRTPEEVSHSWRELPRPTVTRPTWS